MSTSPGRPLPVTASMEEARRRVSAGESVVLILHPDHAALVATEFAGGGLAGGGLAGGGLAGGGLAGGGLAGGGLAGGGLAGGGLAGGGLAGGGLAGGGLAGDGVAGGAVESGGPGRVLLMVGDGADPSVVRAAEEMAAEMATRAEERPPVPITPTTGGN